jgi:tRNA(Ile)-lysidine synthase
MIKLLGKLPRKFYLAVSGGVDSMAAYDFLKNNHEVTPIFFNHGTKDSDHAEEIVRLFMPKTLIVDKIQNKITKGQSLEEYWRIERSVFFYKVRHAHISQFLGEVPAIVTAHHLDDVVETWLFSSMHGQSKLIEHYNGLVTRPFLLTRKEELENWAEKKKVVYIEDLSNNDTSRMRNYIRHEMMPHVLKVNPGIHKLLANKLRTKHNGQSND